MNKRLSDAQVRALAVLSNCRSVVARPGFVYSRGERHATYLALERRGFVERVGTRVPAWMLTGEGMVAVKDLIKSGRLQKDYGKVVAE